MPRWLYSLLLYLALPMAALRFKAQGWRHAAYRGSLQERLAWRTGRRTDSPLWLHAASVGEVRALAALVHVLGAEAAPLLITVGTPTGGKRARELFGKEHEVRAAPWDLPGATRRFMAATRPRGAVFVETELWPNLIAAARSGGVPLVLVSARLSDRSLQRYLRCARGLMCRTVGAFTAIGAQSEVDRARFIRLGAAPENVSVMGNLKFDLPMDAAVSERGASLRARWARHRPLWVAGSTHPGEEEELLAVQRRVLADARASGTAAPLLAFAPRHPERFTTVARALAAQDLRWASLTSEGSSEEPPEVLLIDAMGVLQDWYAAADVTFVGGSLVPVGGHNLLEPAALGKPVLTGPHTFNAPDAVRCLIEAGGARAVRDTAELAQSLSAWLADSQARAAAGSSAAQAVRANRGAAQRARALLTERGVVPERSPWSPVPAAGSAP